MLPVTFGNEAKSPEKFFDKKICEADWLHVYLRSRSASYYHSLDATFFKLLQTPPDERSSFWLPFRQWLVSPIRRSGVQAAEGQGRFLILFPQLLLRLHLSHPFPGVVLDIAAANEVVRIAFKIVPDPIWAKPFPLLEAGLTGRLAEFVCHAPRARPDASYYIR